MSIHSDSMKWSRHDTVQVGSGMVVVRVTGILDSSISNSSQRCEFLILNGLLLQGHACRAIMMKKEQCSMDAIKNCPVSAPEGEL